MTYIRSSFSRTCCGGSWHSRILVVEDLFSSSFMCLWKCYGYIVNRHRAFFIFGAEIVGFDSLTAAARFSIISSIGHIEIRGRAGTGRFQRKLLGIRSLKIGRQPAHQRNAIARRLFNSKGAARSQGCDQAVPAHMNSDRRRQPGAWPATAPL